MRSNLETTYQKTNKKIDVANIKKNNQIQFFTASEQLLLWIRIMHFEWIEPETKLYDIHQSK